jgi:N-acetylneuraminate synthase
MERVAEMNIIPVPSAATLPVRTVPNLPWPIAERVFVIAEIGINHNGDLALAKRLIDVAHAAGCDAVKFQKRTIDVVYTPDVLAQPRQSPWGATQREQKEGLEFGEAEYDAIDAYCRELGIDWFASAWDVDSQAFLAKYKLKYNKIASAMITNRAVVEAVAREKRLTFLSTGMSTIHEVDAAVEIFRQHDCPFVLMHTVSTYPTAENELNLITLETLRRRYGTAVGYSGHEASVEPSILAALLGAVAIERHITLDRTMYGSDQSASLEPAELVALVQRMRALPSLIGDGEKRVTEGEEAVARKLRYWPSSENILEPTPLS